MELVAAGTAIVIGCNGSAVLAAGSAVLLLGCCCFCCHTFPVAAVAVAVAVAVVVVVVAGSQTNCPPNLPMTSSHPTHPDLSHSPNAAVCAKEIPVSPSHTQVTTVP